jgi:hypothetical protein
MVGVKFWVGKNLQQVLSEESLACLMKEWEPRQGWNVAHGVFYQVLSCMGRCVRIDQLAM